jgi:hypothetical protein
MSNIRIVCPPHSQGFLKVFMRGTQYLRSETLSKCPKISIGYKYGIYIWYIHMVKISIWV